MRMSDLVMQYAMYDFDNLIRKHFLTVTELCKDASSVDHVCSVIQLSLEIYFVMYLLCFFNKIKNTKCMALQ